MTRIYERPGVAHAGHGWTRALIIGAGHYPHTAAGIEDVPVLRNLTSVAPSVLDFATRLIRDWGEDLAAPLATVDFLLSDPAVPLGSTWTSLGVMGEPEGGTPIAGATLANTKAALTASLQAANEADHFLFLCCGHGFWRGGGRYFILSDFGEDQNDPWQSVISLNSFQLGLRQRKPRTQWLFFDCCSDMPAAVLEALGEVGDPLIQPTVRGIANSAANFGGLSTFGLSSSAPGAQAFGIPNKPSRFCEILVDALMGAGAVSRQGGDWWVDQRGLLDAFQTYAERHPEIWNAEFYKFATPISSDSLGRMRLLRVTEPLSHVVATSTPSIAMKSASVDIVQDGAVDPCWSKNPVGKARLHVALPARRFYTIAANFNGEVLRRNVFAELPLAEPAEFKI